MICLLLAAPSAVEGQVRVEGEVLDNVTGLPVSGVVVQFPNLGLAAMTDEMGYFEFEEVSGELQVISTYHFAYQALAAETPIVSGDVLALNLTPRPLQIRGIPVNARTREELEVMMQGRSSDYMGREAIEKQAERQSRVVEVLRVLAPPRLQIRQQGGNGAMQFCIQSSRQSPSVQEMRDLGIGCRQSLIVMDGVVIYAPPSTSDFAGDQAVLPSDVAAMILEQNPEVIESIRVLTPSDGFFRYGDAGRLGAVVIVTKRPVPPRIR